LTDEIAPEGTGQVANAAPVDEGQAEEEQAKEWYDGADEETIGYIQNKAWKSPLEAITSYKELETFRGASEDKLLFLPKDPEAEGAYDAIYTKLGRPETPDDYKVDIPEEMTIDENRMAMFKQEAHKQGLNDKAFNSFIKADAAYNAKVNEEIETELSKQQSIEVDQLKKDWGKGYEEKAELGRRFIRDNMPEGVDSKAMLNAIERAIGTGVTLRLFGNAGQQGTREDAISDSSGDRPFGYTKEQAIADKKVLMSEIQGDRTRLDNYNKGIGPDGAKMDKLQKIIAQQ